MKKVTDIPLLDRPREKLKLRGPGALSDVELLAAMLGSGTRGHDVFSLSKKLLVQIDMHNGDLEFGHLAEVSGVGEAKACQLLAAIEFSKRRIRPPHQRISAPVDVLPFLSPYRNQKQEYFICVSLDGANSVIATRVVSIGLANKTHVHPREVFAEPITDRASAVIVAHNHPSGELTPSPQDIKATKQLVKAGEILGIPLLDHLIVTSSGFISLKEESGII